MHTTTRAGEACTSDRQPVNGNSYSCLCERSLKPVVQGVQYNRLRLERDTSKVSLTQTAQHSAQSDSYI